MSHTDKMRALLDSLDGKQQLNEGYRVIPPIDRDAFGDREHEGLEGPINANGRPLYYDPKEGKYYDPRTDMYLDHDEALDALKEGARYSGLRRGDSVTVKCRSYHGETGKVMALGDGGRHVVGGHGRGDQVVVELDSGLIRSFNTEDLQTNNGTNEEQIDELSPKTIGSYVRGAAGDINDVAYSQGRQHERVKNPDKYDRRAEIRADDKIHRRQQGIDRAMNRLTKEGQLDEISDELVNRTTDARLDAVKSADRSNRDELMSKFDKFRKNQRLSTNRDVRQQKAGIKGRDPRSAEYQDAEPGRRNFGDSVECHDEILDELSPDTLKSYGKKAAGEIRGKTMQHGRALDSYGRANSEKKAAALRPGVDNAARKLKNREQGVQRAFDRLEEQPVNELSRDTLKSYAKKATGDIASHSKNLGKMQAYSSGGQADSMNKIRKRTAGHGRAIDRLSEAHDQSIAELKQVLNENKKC